MVNESCIKIGIVDDHQLFREGLINLIDKLDPSFKTIAEYSNGKQFIEAVESGLEVDVILMDLNMPVMNGLVTVEHLNQGFPELKCLVLTMKDDDITLIKLLKAGAKGFLNKDAEPEELKAAIHSIHQFGYYYPPIVADKLVGVLRNPNSFPSEKNKLNDQELRFLELACTEYTYKEIADIMCLSIKTIDGYRGRLFEKLDVKSRVGLVLFAIKNKIVAIN